MSQKKLFYNTKSNYPFINKNVIIEEHKIDDVVFKYSRGIFVDFCDSKSCYIMFNIGDNVEKKCNKNIENHGENNVEDNDKKINVEDDDKKINNIDKQVIIENKIISQKKKDINYKFKIINIELKYVIFSN
jgi:hypothetical protein